jgi:hypothetical protein
MNNLMKSATLMTKRHRFGVFVSSHHLMGIQPDSTRLALSSLFPDRNPHEIMAMIQQGKKCLVREGSQTCLEEYAARIYSLGFQVEVLPLD